MFVGVCGCFEGVLGCLWCLGVFGGVFAVFLPKKKKFQTHQKKNKNKKNLGAPHHGVAKIRVLDIKTDLKIQILSGSNICIIMLRLLFWINFWHRKRLPQKKNFLIVRFSVMELNYFFLIILIIFSKTKKGQF